VPELQERAPRKRKAQPKTQKRRPQPRRQDETFFEFEFGTFMFVEPFEGFRLWNSAAVMRRNGYHPSGVASFLNMEFGIDFYEESNTRFVPIEALEFFEKLVISDGMPSLLRDNHWGTA
jgi:hypothetical protein